MQAWLSWFPSVSLYAAYRLRAGRELFYKTAAKAVSCDRVVSTLACGAFVAGLVSIAWQPFSVAGPVLGLILVVAPFAWRAPRRHATLHGGIAIGLLATHQNLSWTTIGLVVANLVAAALLAIEQRLNRTRHFKSLYLGNTNIGSARLLRGHVEIAHLFLDTNLQWRANKVTATTKRVDRACRWLDNEARRYGVRVSFSHRQIEVADGQWAWELPNFENDYAGLQDFEMFLDRQLAASQWPEVEPVDNQPRWSRCLIVHVAGRTDERAFARPAFAGGGDRLTRVEYAIVAAGENAATIAHELLHLFGADDFYFDSRFRSGSYSGHIGKLLDSDNSHWLQRCVMFRTCVPLRELSVDDQTAQKIGWL
jgi:hypothetical protein